MLRQAGAGWESVEIADDPQLLERYGVRIPVIRDAAGRELGWPFDVHRLQEFLAGTG